MKFQIPKSDDRAICRLLAALAIFALSFFALRSVFAVEPIDTPEPAINSEVQNAPQSVDQFNAAPQFDESQTYEIAPNGQLRVFPAVLERRFGPVEQCEPEFYTLKNSDEPGFAWNPPGFGFGGWGGWWPFRFSWPGFVLGVALAAAWPTFPTFRIRTSRIQPLLFPAMVRFAQSASLEQQISLVLPRRRRPEHLSALVSIEKRLAVVLAAGRWAEYLHAQLFVAIELSLVFAKWPGTEHLHAIVAIRRLFLLVATIAPAGR